MKVIAMYLPQFHRVRENDEWWGEGFTEWTAVQSAEKLFDNHEQPRVPLDNRYYDLLDKNTMSWQSELMHKYQIDGMCFYHYYFKGGKKILEKPAENLLKWNDINMPFCFSWANESWVRSWSNLSKSNPWFSIFDDEVYRNEGDSGILIEQDYGDRTAWEEHYRYLSPFFHDPRYIRYDNMPVFNIELFWKANCFYYVQYSLYHHCMDNSNSLTHRFVLEDMLIFLRALLEYVSVEERLMEETFSDFCRVVADFYIVTIQKMILAGYDEEKHFKRINEAIGDSFKCVFEYVPKTWLFMLKRELYANPIRSVYEGYLELLGKLNNFENKREKLYIYGAGRKAKRIAVFLARKNINFDSFIVGDGNKLNESPDMKYPVITLSKLMKMANPSDISIILALKDDFAEDVLKTLSIYKFKNILYFL